MPPVDNRRSLKMAALLAALFLPTMTLIPLGSLWLWQRGYLLHWALSTAAFVALAFLIQAWIFKSDGRTGIDSKDANDNSPDDSADQNWTSAEVQAWAEVVRIAKAVDVANLNSRDAIFELGSKTVRAVARSLHPEVKEPLWQFTAPEAFAIVERISGRMRRFTADNIPLSDRLTVAQVLGLYRWRGALGIVEKAYDVWRLMRFINPLSAATHELRERMSKQMLNMGRDHIAQRLATVYVKEVGRAAIDLYGGRLRVTPEALEATISQATKVENNILAGRKTEPLRILVAGQSGAGKSGLINALANEIHAAVDALPSASEFGTYELHNAEFPTARIVDTPGIGGAKTDLGALITRIVDCDLVLWVVAAHRADREADRVAIAAVRTAFSRMNHRSAPPILIVLTHIDQLRPYNDWAPPYDLIAADRQKAIAIRTAVDVIAQDLDFSVADAIPVSLSTNKPYNIDALWSRMLMALPDVQRAQLMRRLHDAKTTWDWEHIWSQAKGAGRVIGQTLKP